MVNSVMSVSVLPGGGHIVGVHPVRTGEVLTEVDPLWTPPWETCDPALSRLSAIVEGPPTLEARTLASIMGHNMCCDVFGAHSAGEVKESQAAFHGEAGQVTWTAYPGGSEDGYDLRMEAVLPHAQLKISREFTLTDKCSVKETVQNLVGFQRVYGCAQHVTLGSSFLSGGCTFRANFDKGVVSAEDMGSAQAMRPGAEFTGTTIPGKVVGAPPLDWAIYPRGEAPSTDLCSTRVDPTSALGFFSAFQPRLGARLTYTWRREDYPFLVTWEENCGRDHAPWLNRTLTRGLEFSSYGFPTSRETNVAAGTVLDAPAFQWLDAHEAKVTHYALAVEVDVAGPAEEPLAL